MSLSPVDLFFCILQINLPSGLISSLDVAMSDGKLFSGGRSPEDFGSRQFPKVYLLNHLCADFTCFIEDKQYRKLCGSAPLLFFM